LTGVKSRDIIGLCKVKISLNNRKPSTEMSPGEREPVRAAKVSWSSFCNLQGSFVLVAHMDKITIRNWDKWQSYRKDRGQPPWIKIHRRLLRNPEWVMLSDAERGQMVAMWLLAADHDGVIPASSDLIQKLCYMSKAPDLNKFTELGFLENGWRQHGVNMASSCLPNVTPKADTEADTEVGKKNTIPSKFVGEFKNVHLTDEEMQKLIDQFGKQNTQERIERLSEYIASKGKKYKSHYATILAWARKDGDRSTEQRFDKKTAKSVRNIQEWLDEEEAKR